MKKVVLCSGGFDSVCLMHHLKMTLSPDDKMTAVFFKYDQNSLEEELRCARKVCEKMNVDLMEVTLPAFDWSSSCVVGGFSTNTYVEMRNMIFISYAASIAQAIKADQIFMALVGNTADMYKDCSPDFVNKVNVLLNGFDVELVAPFLYTNKEDLLYYVRKFNIDQDDFYSCLGTEDITNEPCDNCKFFDKFYAEKVLPNKADDLFYAKMDCELNNFVRSYPIERATLEFEPGYVRLNTVKLDPKFLNEKLGLLNIKKLTIDTDVIDGKYIPSFISALTNIDQFTFRLPLKNVSSGCVFKDANFLLPPNSDIMLVIKDCFEGGSVEDTYRALEFTQDVSISTNLTRRFNAETLHRFFNAGLDSIELVADDMGYIIFKEELYHMINDICYKFNDEVKSKITIVVSKHYKELFGMLSRDVDLLTNRYKGINLELDAYCIKGFKEIYINQNGEVKGWCSEVDYNPADTLEKVNSLEELKSLICKCPREYYDGVHNDICGHGIDFKSY